MDFSNVGIGLTSALQGFESGRAAGKEVQRQMDDNAVKRANSKAQSDAKADRDADIAGKMTVTGVDAKGKPNAWQVNGQKYTDESQAKRAAADGVPSVQDYFNTSYAPSVSKIMRDQGRYDEADRWDDHAQSDLTKSYMKSAQGLIQAQAAGDAHGAISHAMTLYNMSNPGTVASHATPVLDSNGKTSAFSVTATGPDGKDFTQLIPASADHIVSLVSQHADPMTFFNNAMAQRAAAATEAAKVAEIDRKGVWGMRGIGIEQTGANQRNAVDNTTSRLNNAATNQGETMRTQMRIGSEEQAPQRAIDARLRGLDAMGYTVNPQTDALPIVGVSGTQQRPQQDPTGSGKIFGTLLEGETSMGLPVDPADLTQKTIALTKARSDAMRGASGISTAAKPDAFGPQTMTSQTPAASAVPLYDPDQNDNQD